MLPLVPLEIERCSANAAYCEQTETNSLRWYGCDVYAMHSTSMQQKLRPREKEKTRTYSKRDTLAVINHSFTLIDQRAKPFARI